MSRLHRQKLRARARDEHRQFTRGDVAAEAAEQRAADATPAPVKPARAKRSRRKAVRKSKAKTAKHK